MAQVGFSDGIFRSVPINTHQEPQPHGMNSSEKDVGPFPQRSAWETYPEPQL